MSNRQERASSEIQKCLIEIIQHKMNDPRLNQVISLTEVKVSPDFQFCKVKVSVLDLKEAKNVVNVLQKSEGFIKRELKDMIDLPYMPKFKFEVDKGTASVIKVEEILKKLDNTKEESDDEEWNVW